MSYLRFRLQQLPLTTDLKATVRGSQVNRLLLPVIVTGKLCYKLATQYRHLPLRASRQARLSLRLPLYLPS